MTKGSLYSYWTYAEISGEAIGEAVGEAGSLDSGS